MSIKDVRLAFVSIVMFATQVWAVESEIDFSLLGDTAHLEFSGRDQWTYDLKKKTEKNRTWVEIQVPRLSAKAVARLRKIQGGPIKATEVMPGIGDAPDLVRFELVSQDTETFDYLTDRPSRLIVDLYPQKPRTVKAEGGGKKDETPAVAKAKDAKTKPGRGIATTDVLIVRNDALEDLQKAPPPGGVQAGIFDGSDPDFSRFSIQDYEVREDSIIRSREKDYIDFPMLHEEPRELQVLEARRPVYEITPIAEGTPEEMNENKMARLLLTLFMNKRHLVFLKTVDWFFEKYPQSKYDEIVRFMWADTHYQLYQETGDRGHFDLSMFRYREALQKYPKSALAERTQLFMGFANLDRGDYLNTLRMFQQHLGQRPSSPNRDLARLALAEAFLKLNQYDDALRSYEQVEKDARKPEDRVKAAYLKGDVEFQRKNDAKAISHYREAVTKHPEAQGEFPNAVFNQAASLFRQGDYRASLSQYREFLKRFPSHPYAGYAMTRVGELLDILGADPSRVMGAYLETYFRYGDSPSAVVARLRLLSSRMKGMKPKEAETAVQNIMELSRKSNLPRIDQFATWLVADGYTSRGQYDQAIDLLVKFYQDNVTTADTQRLQTKIIRNINDKIREQVQGGKFIDALKTHGKYADSWLKSSDRIDTRFWIGRAFEQAGVFAESAKLYRDTLNRMYALKDSKARQERALFEKLPTQDELHLRLASSEFNQGRFSQAFEQIKNIEKPEELSEREQIERVQMISSLLEKKGDNEYALRYLAELIKTWKGVPSLAAGPYFDAGEIELRLKRADDALKSFTTVDSLMKDSGQVPPSLHAQALERIAQIHLDKGEPDKALPVLERLLKTYEKDRPLASWRYRMGRIHFEKGEVQKASEIWNELKGDKNDFWFKLAQEQLKGSEWRDDYKKYIQRIPAMSEKD